MLSVIVILYYIHYYSCDNIIVGTQRNEKIVKLREQFKCTVHILLTVQRCSGVRFSDILKGKGLVNNATTLRVLYGIYNAIKYRHNKQVQATQQTV